MNFLTLTLITIAVVGILLLLVNQWMNPTDCNKENSGTMPQVVGAILASLLIVAGFFGLL